MEKGSWEDNDFNENGVLKPLGNSRHITLLMIPTSQQNKFFDFLIIITGENDYFCNAMWSFKLQKLEIIFNVVI